MKAIILVAGSGRRMRPHTTAMHKTLLRVGGKSLIQRIIDPLLKHGVTDIALVTGFMAEDIKSHLAEVYPELEFQYIYNERYGQSNNVYSMALALDQLRIDSDVILIECDLIFEAAIIERLLQSPHPNVAVVDRYRSGMDGTVVKVRDGVVTDVIPPHLQDANFDFGDKFKTLNIYRFSQEFCVGPFRKLLSYYATMVDDKVYYELVLGIIIYLGRETVHALVLGDEQWAELDDPNDLEGAEYLFDKESRKRTLEESHGGYWNYGVLDFCYIRNMYFPNGSVLSELRNNLPETLFNYGSAQRVLDRKLAYLLLCREERVTVLNGASQVYPILKKWFAGSKVLLPQPTFGEYGRVFPGAESYADEVGVNFDEVVSQGKVCDVVVFVNPNNPTGSTLCTQSIFDFAAAHPGIAVIVDESFIDFSGEDSILKLLEETPLSNVLLLKSLSKVLGVPGLRLGYAYTCNPDWSAGIKAELPIWNLNSVAESFLKIVLKHRDSIESSYVQTMQVRKLFAEELHRVPFIRRVFPSGGNFILVALSCGLENCNELVEWLIEEHNIYVKDVSSKFRDGHPYLRLAVRTLEENRTLIGCLMDWRQVLPRSP